MSKPSKNLSTQNIIMRRLIVITLVLPLVPLILEFFVLIPFVFFHLLTPDTFWALGISVCVSAFVAMALNIITAIVLLLGGKKYITDEPTRSLGNWVIGMSAVYVAVLIVAAFVFFSSSR